MSYIDIDAIYAATGGGKDIICEVYPQARDCFGKKKKFRIRSETDDPNPSCSLIEKNGIWLLTDFGGGANAGKAQTPINIYKDVKNLSFQEAIQSIAEKFNIKSDFAQTNIKEPEPDVEFRPATADEKETEYYFELKEELDERDLFELGPTATIEGCKRYNCYSIISYTYIHNRKAIINKANSSYPMFLFDHGIHKKLYFPRQKPPKKDEEKSKKDKYQRQRFFKIGNQPANFIGGIVQLEKAVKKIAKNNEHEDANQKDGISDKNTTTTTAKANKVPVVYICSGERDSMNIAGLGYYVLWLNSETATLSQEVFAKIYNLADRIINIPDIDATGKLMGRRMALRFMAIKTLWLPDELLDKKDWKDKSCKDVTDYLRFYKKEAFEKLASSAVDLTFWKYEGKIRKQAVYSVNNDSYHEFLAANGFYIYKKFTDEECFLYIEENIITRIPTKEWRRIRQYALDYIRKYHFDQDLINNMLRSDQLKNESLRDLPEYFPKTTYCGSDFQYYFFKNSAVKVGKDKIEEINYSDLKIQVWKEKIIDHVFSNENLFFAAHKENDAYKLDFINPNNFSFINFVLNTSRVYWEKQEAGEDLTEAEMLEEQQHFLNKCYCIGYLLHRYKADEKAFAVITMDARESSIGASNGGAGKSLMLSSLKFMIKMLEIDGRNKQRTQSQFLFNGVSKEIDNVFINDAHLQFDFEMLFNMITNTMEVEGKQQNTTYIDFADSPKISITTNHAIRNLQDSSMRRILFMAFSDYYHYKSKTRKEQSPYAEFGKLIPKGYDKNEFNQYYNFMLQCLQFYLNCDIKLNPPMEQIERRNIRQAIGEYFLDWADEFFSDKSKLNAKISRKAVNDAANATLGNKGSLTAQRLKDKLEAWCEYRGHIFNPENLSNKERRIITKHDGKTIEVFYIQEEGKEINNNAFVIE